MARSTGVPRDRGSALMLMMVIVALCGLLAVAVADAGVMLVRRQRAQAAADAAALAGTTLGRPGAARLAVANGARLESFVDDGRGVLVVVEVAGVRARARATDEP